MTLQPLDDRIVVRPSEAEEKTASGLVIPDTARKSPSRARFSPSGRVGAPRTPANSSPST